MGEIGNVGKGKKPDDPKHKKNVDGESFKKEMMKVRKVKDIDPDERSKRKTQSESEEDFAAEKSGSLLSQGPGPGAPPPPFFSENVSSPQVDTGSTHIPENLPASKSSIFNDPGSSQSQKPLEPQKSSPRKPSSRKSSKKKTHTTHSNDKKKVLTKVKTSSQEKTHPSKPPKSPPPEKDLPIIEKTKSKKEKPKIEKKKSEEQKAEDASQQAKNLVQQSPTTKGEITSEKEKKKEKITDTVKSASIETKLQNSPEHITSQEASVESSQPVSSPFANLHPQVVHLFEKMVGVMMIMEHSGKKETTLSLDNPQFEKSVFYGSKIVITEYSTAPLEFNIEISGNQQAIDLMGANANELVAAFEAGKYNFKLNRLDLSLSQKTTAARREEAKKVKRKKTGGG